MKSFYSEFRLRFFHRQAALLVSRWLFVLLALSFQVSLAQTPTPFDCSTGLGYILTNPTTNANGNVTSFYSFNLSDGSSTLIKAGVLPEPNRFLNGFGYNTADNFLYGYRYNTNQIARLGSNGEIQLLTVSGLSMSGNFASGDVSPDGILYLYGSAGVVAINLNPTSPDYLVAKTRLSGSATAALNGLNDWTFNPVDGKIYGMTTAKNLVSYDPATNTVTPLGPVNGLASETGAFGTAFMDSFGNMYIGNNASGNIYKISTPNMASSPFTATLFSSSLAGKSPGDGARCANQIVLPSANDDQACLTSATAPLSLSVVANDGAGSFPLDPASVRLVDPASGSDVTSVTIAGEGTYSVNTTTGVVTFSPASEFTASTVTYTINDTQGGKSGPATLTVSLCSLPVRLVSFTARGVEQAITTNWKTSEEINFDHFELERTLDPRSGFEFLASLAPKPDVMKGDYSYLDKTVQPNTYYYYRLKMVDRDGRYEYSKVQSARWELIGTLKIFPNPVATNLTVTCAEPIASFRLTNSSGKKVLSQAELNTAQLTFSVTNLATGLYDLQITTRTGVSESRKVIIRK
ncbi:putative secreted protein (Por secretion system target) [Larkinella arboricola]|uniref:Putative secreted protein (Por secretion system target) n=1 Tax=Larkinella arboricola TaxID=643671 RepID=A0A327WTC2_LARAB|nr:T9SS type A sorting domain-containing protein [Larkinella arboricola]RAJ95753.1 putative secreted protein (Por secretion system target) [Larkinella arboricola]